MKTQNDAIAFLDNVIDKKIPSFNKTLVELTSFNNIPLWWFVHYIFCNLIIDISQGETAKNGNTRSNIILSLKLYRLMVDLRLAKVMLSKLLFKIQKKTDTTSDKKHSIIFTSEDIEWKIVKDFNQNFTGKSDAFFHSILINLSSKNINLVGMYPLAHSIRSIKILIEKLRNWKITYVPFQFFWRLKCRKAEKNAFKYFEKCWYSLDNSKSFRELWVVNGENIYQKVRYQLRYCFCIMFPYIVNCIETSCKMIELKKPDMILLEKETGIFERSIIVSAKLKNVPTVAIQHGVIGPSCYYYFFKTKKAQIVLPDLLCLYGRYYYNLLIQKGNYNKNQLVITGSPKSDILFNIAKIYSRKETILKYSINESNKILLWPTQCHGLSDEENIKNFESVFGSVHGMTNITLIIKQHPGEGQKHFRLIEKYLRRYNINSIILPGNSDIYELLYVCDFMITKNSTTADEAIALGKPVIILNLSGIPDIVSYVNHGVALGVYTKTDLRPAIEKLVNGAKDLEIYRERYIDEYMYKIDGKANDRICELILRTIQCQDRKN